MGSVMKKARFTLVEILVALVIVGILAAIVASGSGFVSYMMKEAKTKSQIQKLELALEQYKSEYDFYYIPCEIKSSGDIEFFEEGREFNPEPNPYANGKTLKFSTKTVLQMDAGMIKFCPRDENVKNERDNKYMPKTFLGEDYIWYDGENRFSGLRDGWGNLLMYRCPGKYNESKFDIWSRGPDGEGLKYTDTNQSEDDDITNWKLQK